MTTQPGPQAATLGQQVPAPTFASVRVEFTDGTFREFCIHKPLRTEIDIPAPAYGLPPLHNADLGALPPALIPPELPRISVRIQAGISRDGQVMTVDSRRGEGACGSFTRDELKAAMDRLGWYAMHDEHGRHPADRIAADMELHRDPKAGDQR